MIDWQQIQTVLLDMDGTLLDLRFDNFFWQEYVFQVYADQHGISPAQARQKLEPRFEQWRGTLQWYCLDFWTEQLGLDIATLKRQVRHKIAVKPSTMDFLEFLKSHHCQVALVTNAHPVALEIKMLQTGLADYFDALFSSHQFHRPKEDPAFWSSFQQSFPFDPAHTLLIDDSESVLESAETFGIRYLLSIHQPDSTVPGKHHPHFATITSFHDILPAADS